MKNEIVESYAYDLNENLHSVKVECIIHRNDLEIHIIEKPAGVVFGDLLIDIMHDIEIAFLMRKFDTVKLIEK